MNDLEKTAVPILKRLTLAGDRIELNQAKAEVIEFVRDLIAEVGRLSAITFVEPEPVVKVLNMEVERLKAENETLRTDKERLDWLMSQSALNKGCGLGRFMCGSFEMWLDRDTIDREMSK